MLLELDPAGIPNLPGAACTDIPTPEVFFAFEPHRIEQALTHDEDGIWAATTPQQRGQLLARHRKEAS